MFVHVFKLIFFKYCLVLQEILELESTKKNILSSNVKSQKIKIFMSQYLLNTPPPLQNIFESLAFLFIKL